ncbi:hypothetical protein HPB50_014356 [Hyalomma asiaticum]|uniref:Uncharacterized protein n=1 Tax=Hyalomma asiaticum TaxID=266040 RepID=A0ACB7SH00_HYAAI|nr:hypothetical protein HPB50_014356 [Hyalomma asiaticum]
MACSAADEEALEEHLGGEDPSGPLCRVPATVGAEDSDQAALTAMVVCLTWGCQAPAALCAPVLGPPQPPPQTTATTTFCSVIPIHPWKQS